MTTITKNFTGGGGGGTVGGATDAKIEELKLALQSVITAEGDQTQVDLVTLIASTGALQASNVLESNQSQISLASIITNLQQLKASNETGSTTLDTLITAFKVEGHTDALSIEALLTSLDSIVSADNIQATKSTTTHTANYVIPAGAKQVTVVNNGDGDLVVDGQPIPPSGVFKEDAWTFGRLPPISIVVTAGTPSYHVRTLGV